ncbi:DUF4352 domain-containing protein [Candidatus Saccharibacteria bacterium]|nr:MAG: DUF4352 domain-containing protein [Candidatus Saccharibacteria bacterium]
MKKHETPIEKIEDAIEHEANKLKREYKRFEKFRDENNLLFGVFVAAIVALLVVNTLFWAQYTARRYDKENRVTTTVANLTSSTSLQTAHNFALSARVSNVGTKTEQDRAFPIDPGKTLLIMDVTVTNKTTTDQQLIPVTQFYVRTTDGQYATLYPSSRLRQALLPQDLRPGQSATGQLSFAISDRTSMPLLYIDTMWNRATPLVIDVLH